MRRWLSTIAALTVLVSCQNEPSRDIEHPRLDDLAAPVAEALTQARQDWQAALGTARSDQARATASGQLGRIYQAHHFNRAARDCYRVATRHDAQDARWHYYLGVVTQELGEFDEAERAFGAAVELDAALWQAHYRSAQAMLARGDTTAATPLIAALSRQRPDDAAVLALAGHAALLMQDTALARRHFERAVQLAPEARRLYHPLAQAARAQGDHRAAEGYLTRAGDGDVTLHDPLLRELDGLSRSPQFYMQRGQTRLAQKNLRGAAEDLATAVELAPDDPAALAAYGRALELLGRVDDARVNLESALRLDAQHAVAHYFLGALLERQSADERALDHYRAAVDADPQYLNPRLLLAHGLMRSGRTVEAAEHYAHVATLRPGNITARYYLGLARLQNGDCDGAAAALGEARAVQPNYGPVLEAVIRMQAVCGVADESQDALTWARALAAARPGSRSAVTLAMAQAAAGRFDEAVATQLDALNSIDDPLSDQAMRANLERYRNRRRPRHAWPPGSDEIHPPRLIAEVE